MKVLNNYIYDTPTSLEALVVMLQNYELHEPKVLASELLDNLINDYSSFYHYANNLETELRRDINEVILDELVFAPSIYTKEEKRGICTLIFAALTDILSLLLGTIDVKIEEYRYYLDIYTNHICISEIDVRG